MAKQSGKVYLGYDEDVISADDQSKLTYTVNKIGGLPDWPPVENIQFQSKCPLCGLHRLLLVQCYVPLENSAYHRTLYVFACINPNCWIQSESWLCVRSQIQDEDGDPPLPDDVVSSNPYQDCFWCGNADEWDENDNGDSANGNVMDIDNASPKNVLHRNSDEDEESNSFELETVEQALGNLQVYDAHNANMSPVQGAVGAIGVPAAAAELEGGDEPGLVTVDTPTAPTNDVQALLHQTAELPAELRSRLMRGPLQFQPKYMFVAEERRQTTPNDDRINDLLNKYKRENAEIEACVVGDRAGGGEDEPYEDTVPLHGDKLFHAFLTRLRTNPGQILRYSRDSAPLLGAPLSPESPGGAPAQCARCGSRLTCELQLVPEFTSTLRLPPNNTSLPHLHFLSVLIFTCSQSCWQSTDSLVQETVVFQPEVI